ncbi:MAG: hypothetical protein IJQ18_07680 [Paludibacteraceae bacterium]|jgi:hypothetical protein|nr:hypothetical protein [Paludibacteraceae bacterium]
MKNIFRIVTVCEPQKITKNDGSELIKQQLVIREQGGPYEDAYLVTWFGQEALRLTQGMCIAASIRMRVNEGVYATGDVPETRYYQDAVLQEYACLMLGNIKS